MLVAVATLVLAAGACDSGSPVAGRGNRAGSGPAGSGGGSGSGHAAASRFACPSRQAVSDAVGGRPVPTPKRTMPASLTVLCSYASVDAAADSPILIFAITFGTNASQLESIARATADGKVTPVSGLGETAFQSRSDGQLQIFVENRGRSVSCTFGDDDHLTADQRNKALQLFL